MAAKPPTRHRVFPLNEESVYFARKAGVLLKRRHRFRLIDLFSGAGGMTLGFTESSGHRFRPIWANDFNKESVDTYNSYFGQHCVLGDLNQVLKSQRDEIPEADVVIGGPPCQGFSLLNKQRATDERKQLWRPFFEIVEISKAKVFVMENVPQLLGSVEHDQINAKCAELGFQVTSAKLSAADYGVPQTRVRAFIIGCKNADPRMSFPPKRTHFNPNNGAKFQALSGNKEWSKDPMPWLTVRDAISDLAAPVGTEIRNLEDPPYDLHFGRSPTELSKKRYRAIPKEGMNRFDLQERALELTPRCWIKKKSGGTDLFGRLWWDRPAVTMRTEFFKPEKGRYLHPKQHRPITHREAARFQSFPDSFKFCGSKIEIAKQIGNAVAPVLAARIADSVYSLLIAE